ncbi:DNA-binding protein, partial [Staphylococcus aureus]|uniref:DNA-binding protein n=1 Tax=Staphylococcus aureus TaxID=1280 RepID=UPI0021B476BF
MTLPKIPNPPTPPLNSQPIYTLQPLSQYTNSSLIHIHPLPPKPISIFQQPLFHHQLHFKTQLHSSLPFNLTPHLSSNHPPKPQQIIHFILPTPPLHIQLLPSLLTTQFISSLPPHFHIYPPQILIQ